MIYSSGLAAGFAVRSLPLSILRIHDSLTFHLGPRTRCTQENCGVRFVLLVLTQNAVPTSSLGGYFGFHNTINIYRRINPSVVCNADNNIYIHFR